MNLLNLINSWRNNNYQIQIKVLRYFIPYTFRMPRQFCVPPIRSGHRAIATQKKKCTGHPPGADRCPRPIPAQVQAACQRLLADDRRMQVQASSISA